MMAKISCDLIQDLLPLYCDDVCSADSKNIVETHLQECEACAKLFQQLKSKCIINTKAREEKSAEEVIIGKIAHSWKRSYCCNYTVTSCWRILYFICTTKQYGCL